MSSAGYSGTPLAKKLGLRDGQVVLLLDVPGVLPEIAAFPGFARMATSLEGAAPRQYDYIHSFETERVRLESAAPPWLPG